MDSDTRREIQSELALPSSQLGPISASRRLASISEAMAFPSGHGTQSQRRTTLYAPTGALKIAVGKPGKEFDLVGEKHNPFDMTPCILRDGLDTGYRPTFGDIFRVLQTLGTQDPGHSALEVVASLMFRNAFMLDHRETQPGIWRYVPPPKAMGFLQDNLTEIDSLPPEAFLMLTEALALNEDVKYYVRKGELTESGRQNNLLTCVHLAAVFMNRADLVRFSYDLIKRGGVAPTTQKAAKAWLDLLGPQSPEEVLALMNGLAALRGEGVDTIAAAMSIPMPGQGYTSTHRYILERAAKSVLGLGAWGALNDDYNIKAVRVDRHLLPAEDMSFKTIGSLAAHKEWSQSDLRTEWARPFIFLVFDDQPPARAVFKGVVLNAIPVAELEESVREVYEATVASLRAGKREGLTPSSQSAFFVRDHGGNRTENQAGEKTTPLSFWLSKHYVQQMLVRATVADLTA